MLNSKNYNPSEKELIKNIIKNTKKSFKARTIVNNSGNEVLLKNIANYGLKINQSAIRSSKGEYYGFTIKALEQIKPLLTEIRIIKAIKFLFQNDIQKTIKVLNLDYEVEKFGINIIYSVLKLWLENNNFVVPQEYINKALKIKSKKLKKWILSRRSDPLINKFKIVGIGKSKKGNSVVPESWIDLEFENGYQLHEKMDKLDWRKGKPPVNFCCIYSMTIMDESTWQSYNSNLEKYYPKIGLEILPKKDSDGNLLLNSKGLFFSDNNMFLDWLKKLSKLNNIVFLPTKTINLEKILIVCELSLISKEPFYQKSYNVGLLVSRLQKTIRRGKECSKLLYETVINLSNAPSYNLPEQQFIRVSGSRQLAWRLFISIIEDVEPYINDPKYLNLFDLVSLSCLAQVDHSIQFSEDIVKKIIMTALFVQNNDDIGKNWAWRKGSTKNVNEELSNLDEFDNDINCIRNSLKFALRVMPMMKNDKNMLLKSLDYSKNKTFDKLNIFDLNDLLSNSNQEMEKLCRLASYDMHCKPNMILDYQAFYIPDMNNLMTTKEISSFIWENSSKYNIRHYKHKCIIENMLKSQYVDENKYPILKILQEELDRDQNFIFDIKNQKNIKYNMVSKNNSNKINQNKDNKLLFRIIFLLIFGQKIRLSGTNNKKAIDIIVCGNYIRPCKVKKTNQKCIKYLEGKERFDGELRYIEYMKKENNILIDLPSPPESYLWNPCLLNNKKVHIYVKLIKSNPEEYLNEIEFYANNIKVTSFDGSNLVISLNYPKVFNLTENNYLNDYIKKALYIYPKDIEIIDSILNDFAENNNSSLMTLLKSIHRYRKNNNDYRVYNWIKLAKKSIIITEIWKNIIVKLYNDKNTKNITEIQIGPVNRNGNKIDEAINYKTEGILLRLFNMLSVLYPNVIIPKTHLKFSINKNTEEFIHLLDTLKKLAYHKVPLTNNNIENRRNFKIKTELWKHQKDTCNEMFHGIVDIGRKGYGDSSGVGSGKTLTALSLIAKLCKYNKKMEINNYKGYLILVPTEKLFVTWIDEIYKHTINHHLIKQNANGSLFDITYNKNTENSNITFNTILISTLGRTREHPLSIPWHLVVIDECLSVQNKDALQTEEAWRQVINSHYGVIMMSATFFRSRFDKLFYMIKMLRCGLPEQKNYLDTILSECIICNLPKKTRKWIKTITKFTMSKKMRIEYDKLKNNEIDSDKLYNILAKYLYDNYNYVFCFKKMVERLNSSQKALIYTRSKNEADIVANKINSVTRYPNKTGKHVVLSYAEGAYGLNDLTKYNTIISRPVYPDIIPQMKGRLDRPNQKNNVLYINYFLIKNTIEEAWLIRLEMANNFYKNHIMPLAEFYSLAIKQ